MSTDVDADGQVAAKMAKKSDEDDLMDLWGVSTFVSGGTSNGSGRNRDKADSSSAQPKKRVKGTSSVPVLSAAGDANAADASSSAGVPDSSALQSSWMFGSKLTKSKKPSEHSKD